LTNACSRHAPRFHKIQKKPSLCLLFFGFGRTGRVAGLGASEPGLIVVQGTTFVGLLGNPFAVALFLASVSVFLVVAALRFADIVTGRRAEACWFVNRVKISPERTTIVGFLGHPLARTFRFVLVEVVRVVKASDATRVASCWAEN